jgi:2-polyprenyl-3-methyl-5-hydroxy-6-metoxy-1,4-benzoquinol methylase
MLTPQFDIYTNLRKVLDVPSVLEVGFGTGFGVLQYASGVWDRVDAIEIEQEAVDFAKAALPAPNINWMSGDILTWQNGQYAAVVMIEVLEHISAWDVALRNVRE